MGQTVGIPAENHRPRARAWQIAVAAIVALVALWFGVRFWVERTARTAIYVDSQPQRAADLLERWSPWLGSPAELRWLMAESHRKLGDRGRVQRITDAMASEGIESVQASAPMLLMEAAGGSPNRIKEKLGPLLKLYGKQGPDVLASMVQGYITQGDVPTASQTLRLWSELYGEDYHYEFWQGVLATLNYNLDKAVASFERSIELNPQFPRARQELAQVFVEQAKFEEAQKLYAWLREREPNNNEYVTGYARSLLNLGYPERAAEELQKIKDISNLPSPELALVCETNLEAGQFEAASQQAALLLRRWPYALPYLQLQARCMAKLGRKEESEALFAKAADSQTRRPQVDRMLEQLGVDPGNHELRMTLGETMLKYLDPEGGIGFIQIGSRQVPQDIRGHQILAEFYAREGRDTLAEVHRSLAQQIESSIREQQMGDPSGVEPPMILTPSSLP